MTINDIKRLTKDTLTVADVASILGAHPQWIRDTARKHPDRIGFRFTFSGKRMIIPRLAFIRWFEGN